MALGLLFGQRTALDQLVDIGVVFGELMAVAIANHIEAGIAHMAQNRFVAADRPHHRAGGAHA